MDHKLMLLQIINQGSYRSLIQALTDNEASDICDDHEDHLLDS